MSAQGLAAARRILEASYALPEPLTREELETDRRKLRATLEVVVAYAEELSDPQRHIEPSTEG